MTKTTSASDAATQNRWYLRLFVLCTIVLSLPALSAPAHAQTQTMLTTQQPTEVNQNDGPGLDYELGMLFQSDIAGQITAIRFWKDSNETGPGTHVGRIWSSTGQILASVTFTNESDSGWQQQSLSTPLPISSDTTYVVTVNTLLTYYVATTGGFTAQVVNGHLRTVVGDNGVYGPVGQFPTNTYEGSNYFRDVVFLPAGLASLSLSPSSLIGGTPATGTVTLNGAAPAGGTTVLLSSNSAAATVPASVIVPQGAASTTFGIATSAVVSSTPATILASYNGTLSVSLTVNPATLTNLQFDPSTVTGGAPSTGTVTISGPAPAGGAVVTIVSDNAAAVPPTSVTITAGAATANFTVATSAVATLQAANISVTYLGTTRNASLIIDVAKLSSLTLAPSAVVGGNGSIGTVTLDGPAPAGGAIISLSANSPQVPGLEGFFPPAPFPVGGFVNMADLGPDYTSVASGTVLPVTGLPGVNVTLTTPSGEPMLTLINCAWGGDCSWYGNFAPGVPVLWTSGTYTTETGWWAGHGPLTVTLNAPQRGVGMQIMSDENGSFAATLCGYNAGGTLLGCVPFDGHATGTADNSAVFIGLYDDAPEIAKFTIDTNGPLYPHDFAISSIFVASARRSMAPVSVMIPGGATSASFSLATGAVGVVTNASVTASYVTTATSPLTIYPPALSSINMNPSAVIGGASVVGSAVLSGRAPAGGVTISLSADNPVAPGLQSVGSPAALPQDGFVDWVNVASDGLIPSGATAPVNGVPNLTLTVMSESSQPLQMLTNCPAIAECGWVGNFAPGEPILWPSGTYNDVDGSWLPNGPVTLTLSTPQRGLGFRIMSDESGPFTATLCAYDAADHLIGCSPYAGNATGTPDGTAPFIGLYSDGAAIKRMTIDAGGNLYPHDFAISKVVVATSRRMVPATVKVQPGASAITFPVNTDKVQSVSQEHVTGFYGVSQTGTLSVYPATQP